MSTCREVRAELTAKYGGDKRWVRFNRPVRIVDARPRRNGDHYLAWEYAPLAPWERPARRWISVHNFTRFYRELVPADTTGETT